MEQWENRELCFPQLSNASCWKPRRLHSHSMVIYVVLGSVAVITVFLNLLVIISISHFKQLHTATNLLLLSLAVSDFLVGLLMLFQVMLVDGCWLLGDRVCVMYQYLGHTITSSSVGTMVLISVDRYVAICDPLRYRTRVTLRRVQVWNVLCWLISSTFHSINLSDNLKEPGRYHSCVGECVIVINYITGLIDFIATLIVPTVVILVLYLRVFAVVVTHARAVRSRIAAAAASPAGLKRLEMKAARTLGVVVVVYLICICPFFCMLDMGKDNLVNSESAAVLLFLTFLNSCMNPLIYAFFYPWFRKSVKLILTLKLLQRDSRSMVLM